MDESEKKNESAGDSGNLNPEREFVSGAFGTGRVLEGVAVTMFVSVYAVP